MVQNQKANGSAAPTEAESALLAAQARYRLLADSSGEGVWTVDAAHQTDYINPRGARILGYSRAEIIGRSPAEFFFSREPPSELCKLNEYGHVVPSESILTLRRKDGSPCEVIASIQPIFDAKGHYCGAMAVFGNAAERTRADQAAELKVTNEELTQEIEEREHIEEQLREAEQKANDLIRYAPTAIYEIDFRGPRFTKVNDAMCAMSGYSREELLAKSPFDLLDEDSQKRFAARMSATLAGETIDELVEYRAIPKDGREAYATLQTRLLYEDGKPIGAFVIAHDITERRRAEEALRESQTRFQALVESTSDFIWEMNAQGVYTYCSPQLKALWGFDPEDRVGTTPFDLLPPEDREEAARLFSQLATSGTPLRNLELRSYDAERKIRFLEINGIPFYDAADNLKGYRGITRDITERRLAEEKRERLRHELEQRAVELEIANQELDSFSYSVSHDLRAPLASIAEFAQMLQDDYAVGFPEPAQRYLDLIRSGAHQMDQLVESLLALSRLTRHALKRQTIDMTAIVMHAMETLQQEPARKGLTFDIHYLPEAEADPVLLKQVWINLISNALKFTRRCEKPVIEIGCGPCDGAERAYYIRDNGVGFSMEQADRLFGIFQRLHREEEYEGTGVGLAIVARIVRRHGGRIWAESEPGKGATFYFTLG